MPKNNSGGMRRVGGGIGSSVVRQSPLGKTAKPSANAISPKGVSQIGSNMGDHATGSGKILRKAVEPLSAGRGYSTPVGPANSLNTGPKGQGRTVMRSGSQQGTAAPKAMSPGRDILSDFGPDSAGVRNRR
jgi:hypothetical protein